MRKVAFANIVDEKNLGDMHCNPGRLTYVRDRLREVGWLPVVCDFRAVPGKVDAIVFGGGGMLHPGVDVQMQFLAHNTPTAAWGVGINYHHDHGPDRRNWRKTLNTFKGPVAIRDARDSFDHRYDVTPCPSCLDPRIEHYLKASEATPLAWKARPLVFFHKDRPLACPFMNPAPRLATNDCSTPFASLLNLIGNSSCVVTNTFHGSYWPILMGVPVFMLKGQDFSTRHRTALDLGAQEVACWEAIEGGRKTPQLYNAQAAALEYLGRLLKWLSSL